MINIDKNKLTLLSSLNVCPKSKEYLIYDTTLITIQNPTIFKGWIYIKDGKIEDFGSILDGSLDKYEGIEDRIDIYDGSNYKIIPSFTNAHTHSAMSFFRGFGTTFLQEDPLSSSNSSNTAMIEDFLFPTEKSLTPSDIEIFAYSYLIDGIKHGISCFWDHYYFIDSVAKAADSLGVKAVVGETIADINGAFLTTEEKWNHIKEDILNWKYSSNITPILAPHATDTVSSSLMKSISKFSRDNSLGIHIHLSQTQAERERTYNREKLSPTEYLEKCEALHDKSILVHNVSIDEKDMNIINKYKANICICPISEIIYEKLPPLQMILDTNKYKNTSILIGTDCAASQDSCDIISELKTLSLILKEKGIKTSFNTSKNLLTSITKTPNDILGLNSGEIAKGKNADLVYIKKDISTASDCEFNILNNIIFSSNTKNIEHLSVNGQFVLWKKQCCLISEKNVLDKFNEKFKKIKERSNLKI